MAHHCAPAPRATKSRTGRRIAITVVSLLALLVGVLLFNTLRLPSLPAADGARLPPVADLDAAVERLAAAVRIPTISWGFANPPGGNRFPELHALLEKSFPRVHAKLRRETVSEWSLIYTWPGSDATLPPVLLTAHQDVVPIEPGTEGRWTHPPFGGVVKDGFVWGRGAMDNKQMLMATFEGVERLLAEGYVPKRTIILAFGHDEEVGGHLGAKAIAERLHQRGVRAQFSLDEGAVILEGVIPDATRPIAQIGVAEKGYLSLLLKASATGGHSSMPPPSTAVGKLGRAIARLEAEQMPASLDGPGVAALRAMAPALPFARRVVLANAWLLAPLLQRQLEAKPNTNALIRTTTAPTMINGGIKENVLPSEATAVVNFRLAPGSSVADVKAHVARVVADPDVAISEYNAVGGEATPVADAGGAGFAAISRVIRRIEPAALIVPGLVVAGTDSKHYARVSDAALRFTPMRVGADDLKRVHATDERIAVANYGEIIAFYVTLIRESAQ